MFVILPGRVAICALQWVCLCEWLCVCMCLCVNSPQETPLLSFLHSVIQSLQPFRSIRDGLRLKVRGTLKEKSEFWGCLLVLASNSVRRKDQSQFHFLCMPHRDWSKMCLALRSINMWAGLNSFPPANPKQPYIQYESCYSLLYA